MVKVAGVSSAEDIAAARASTDVPTPATMPESAVTTGDEALQRLIRGNQRFVMAWAANPNQTMERRQQVAEKQAPFAIVLGCSDSRVSPEIIFDQGIGDLFVVRLAGNLFDNYMGLGSIEFAVEQFHSPLLMVLGHENCGAVVSTIEAVQQNAMVPGKIANIVDAIKPIVERVKDQPGDLVNNAVRANVLHVVEQLRNADPLIRTLQADGKLKIVGAYYSLSSGKVEVLT